MNPAQANPVPRRTPAGALPSKWAALRSVAQPCLQCASCVARCPSCANGETVNVRKLIRLVQLGLVEEALRSETLWACALCRACAQSCPAGAAPYKTIAVLREMAVARGLAPRPVAYFARNTLRHGRPLPLPSQEITNWAAGLDLPRRGETIFYAGLYPFMGRVESLLARAARLDPRRFADLSRGLLLLQQLRLDGLAMRFAPRHSGEDVYANSLRRGVHLLERLGVPVAYLHEDEPWCGIELHTYGLSEQFAAHARRVFAQLRRLGVREIITPDTLALTAFRSFYPEVVEGFDITARHLIEVLGTKLDGGLSHRGFSTEVIVYNDPCYLTRYLGLVEEPRNVIRRLGRYQLREVDECGLATRCDGGGGLEVIYPRLALDLAKARAAQLLEAGADKIVTPCPVCVMMLRAGVAALGHTVPVIDLADLVSEAVLGTA